jgi:hypothetical protein
MNICKVIFFISLCMLTPKQIVGVDSLRRIRSLPDMQHADHLIARIAQDQATRAGQLVAAQNNPSYSSILLYTVIPIIIQEGYSAIRPYFQTSIEKKQKKAQSLEYLNSRIEEEKKSISLARIKIKKLNKTTDNDPLASFKNQEVQEELQRVITLEDSLQKLTQKRAKLESELFGL